MPKYAEIKIKNSSKTAKKVKIQAQKLWLKNEIKYLYEKKEKLNKILYKSHLEMLNNNNTINLYNIYTYIEEKLKITAIKINNKHNKKYNKLLNEQHKNKEIFINEHTFYPKIHNLTNIKFNKNEIATLNKGLKYNLPNLNKNKNQIIQEEVTNAEVVISAIKDVKIKNETRIIINKKLNKKLNKTQQHHLTAIYIQDSKNLKTIKKKLNDNNAIAVKADKTNAIVIMTQTEYNNKSYGFINKNSIEKLTEDPTTDYNKQITGL